MFLQLDQDKALIEVCIKGLTSYATECAVVKKCADPLKDTHLTEICYLVEVLEFYWGLNDRLDRRAKVEHSICQAQEKKIRPASTKLKTATINGLYRYASEMVVAQGQDAVPDIKHIQDTIHKIADHWQLDINWVNVICWQIDIKLALLGEEFSMTQRM